MPRHSLPDFPHLGPGVGLRPDHFAKFLGGRPPASVKWVEVVTENYLPWEKSQAAGVFGRSYQKLEKIRQELPVVLHGVSMSLGSVDPLNRGYLKRLKELARRIDAAWISDHLCWTGQGGRNYHDLFPLPYTDEAIRHVSKRIEEAQEFLGRRILIENLSTYVEFESSAMPEWEFLAEVAERADCGILLDINNVYVSAMNHGFDPMSYLRGIPAHRVGQIHLAGHSVREDGFRVDTHDAPVCEEVWELYGRACGLLGSRSFMIERDGNIPEWEELEKEILRAARIGNERNEARITRQPASPLRRIAEVSPGA